jgi:hypothetical protein
MSDGSSDAPERLRAAATAHQPNRERMLARVERGTQRRSPSAARGPRYHRPPPGDWRTRRAGQLPHGLPGWTRVAGAAVAVVVTLGGATVAVAWTADGPQGPPEAASSGGPAADGDQDGATVGADEAPEAVHAVAEVDPSSNAYWSQSNVSVKTGVALTDFTIELRIAGADEGGVRATGAWRTLPSGDFDLSVKTEGEELVFRWELRQGAEIPPGEHIFAGQYDHDRGPRDAGADSYRVEGTGDDGEVSLSGGFG